MAYQDVVILGGPSNTLVLQYQASDTLTRHEAVTFSGTSGTLQYTPAGTIALYRNGLRLKENASDGFTISGRNITLAIAATAGEWFEADY